MVVVVPVGQEEAVDMLMVVVAAAADRLVAESAEMVAADGILAAREADCMVESAPVLVTEAEADLVGSCHKTVVHPLSDSSMNTTGAEAV